MNARDRSRRLFVLVFIVCCHAVGLLVFCEGFLLKRVEIPEYSQCSPRSQQDHSFGAGHIDPATHTSCSGYPRRFKRVLWLLIDALRYDFLVYDDHLDPVPIYRNKLPFIRDLLREQPGNAKLFKSIADPPTTTMQRLKALATGGLPTFIDIGSNFNSYEIQEDNLIYQLKENSRNITFMGDDTWLGLYPGMFNKAFDYPSLNVKDLHTVDDGVISHLLPELAKKDADFIIAHFLGVDHVGHTYGPSHWTMGDKLSQMNDVIKSVLTSLDEDTIAFVFGDHGMTSTGDHGGETELETDAALLIYSSRPIFNSHQPSGRPINQIDIIPTVATTLDIPIPFSSLGMIIPEVFLPYQESNSDSNNFDKSVDDGYSGRVTTDFLVALQENALQIQRYLMTYAQHSGDFPSDVFRSLQGDLDRALELHKSMIEREDIEPSQEELTSIATAYVGYMNEVKIMCQSIWAKFDDVSITEGLILLLLSVVMVPLMLIDIENSTSTFRKALPYGAVCGLGVAIILALLLNIVPFELTTFGGIISLVLVLSLYVLAATIIIFILLSSLAIFQSLKDMLRGRFISFVGQLSVLQLLSIVITVLYSVAMLSNSFVLYEADMVNFFLQSLLVCFAVRSLQIEFNNNANLTLNKTTLIRVARTTAPHFGAMVCIRSVKIFYACRDLQIQDGCMATTFIHALPVAYQFLGGWLAYSRMALSCAAIVSVPVGFLFFVQRSTGARHLNRWLRYVGKYGFLIAVFCVSGFWILLCLPQTDLEMLAPWKHVALPRIVYLISAVAMVLCVVSPFKEVRRVLTMNCEENPANDTTSVTSALNDGTRKDGEFLSEIETQGPRLRRHKSSDSQPIDHSLQATISHVLHPSLTAVIPLANLFVLVALWISIALLLNDSIALSAVLMAAQVALTITGLREKESGSSWPVCVLWGLMSFQFFFGFGHHAIVTSLRFEAGFVGLHGEIHAYNLPVAGALVGLNTLASQLLFGLGLPLLLLLDSNLSENKKAPSDKLFKIILQYIAFHSIKMLVTVLAASIHRRHLMVWWVFAPRFMYEGAFQMTADVCAILSYLFVCRLERLLCSHSGIHPLN